MDADANITVDAAYALESGRVGSDVIKLFLSNRDVSEHVTSVTDGGFYR